MSDYLKTTRTEPKGRRVSLLVCGEGMLGILSGRISDGEISVVIDCHSLCNGTIRRDDVSIWRSRGWCPVGPSVRLNVYDSRPLVAFAK